MIPREGELPSSQVISAASLYWQALSSKQKWFKALRGGVNVKLAARIVLLRWQQRRQAWWRGVCRLAGQPRHDDLIAALQGLLRRRIIVHMIFASGDPGEVPLKEGASAAVARLLRRPGFSIRRIHGADHVFTELSARRQLLEELHRCLRLDELS